MSKNDPAFWWLIGSIEFDWLTLQGTGIVIRVVSWYLESRAIKWCLDPLPHTGWKIEIEWFPVQVS